MIVDGRKIAREMIHTLRDDVAGLPHAPVLRAISVAPSPATESYLRVKKRRAKEAGMTLDIVRLPEDASTDAVTRAFGNDANALLVQLPLPASIDTDRVLAAIPLMKDADVLSQQAHDAFEAGKEGALLPPVVGAVAEILAQAKVDPSGMHAVIIGNGRLVGEPVAAWLKGAGAQVSVITKESGALSALSDAQLVVCGAGVPRLVRPEHLAKGVVLIDAGTSESDGSIVGDADPACAEVASVFTPVPGGIGPVAVACLLRNAYQLAKRGGLQTP